ncbi:hypothetical protein DERF_011461 [Dermatophagoides farinae]|uniref:HSF-type DNA-binding domain-containing protein n=1 Tax=Dermatophagoides farinae TaxID=6954 RepID=A0A922HV07_DERFA|nr:hypothetical protein DERF_011461 [Dermatophagoides farinae]
MTNITDFADCDFLLPIDNDRIYLKDYRSYWTLEPVMSSMCWRSNGEQPPFFSISSISPNFFDRRQSQIITDYDGCNSEMLNADKYLLYQNPEPMISMNDGDVLNIENVKKEYLFDSCDDANHSNYKWELDDFEEKFSTQTLNSVFYSNFDDDGNVHNLITDDQQLFIATIPDHNNGCQMAVHQQQNVQSPVMIKRESSPMFEAERELETISPQPLQNDYDDDHEMVKLSEIADEHIKIKPRKAHGRKSKSMTVLSNNIIDDQQNPESLKPLLAKQKSLLFPLKLWNLTNSSLFKAINWSKNGREIRINIKKLTPFLKQITRSNKFESFLRQLHLYGFRKMDNFNLKKRKFDRNIVRYFRRGFNRFVRNADEIDKIFLRK